jgi:hypothetical protein
MPDLDVGLQRRMKRLAQQTADQHRHLTVIQRELAAALEGGGRADSHGLLERYRAALSAHFDLEQSVFFPALHGLAPARTPDLDALEHEHASFLSELGRLAGEIGAGRAAVCRASLASHLETLRAHERREEALVNAISDEGQ